MKVASLTAIVTTLFTGVTLARSPVYILSQDVGATPDQVSFDAFSMLYSHMVDTSENTLIVQGSDWLPRSKSLFEKKTDANLVVLVSSVQTPKEILPTKEITFHVTDNDNINDYSTFAESTVDDIAENDKDTTAVTIKFPSVCHKERGSKDVCENKEFSFTRFTRHFSEFETALFDENKEADKNFMQEMELVEEYWSGSEIFPNNLIEIDSFKLLAESYGVESKQYKEATRITAHLLENIVIPKFQTVYPHSSFAALVFTPVQSKLMKRKEPDVCYKSARACNNGTFHCQGHGKCVKVDDCYSCQCKPSFLGESCQYIDSVSDFQLLFWTSVLLIVITTSVVACIYQSGNNLDTGIIMTQSPPKQE